MTQRLEQATDAVLPRRGAKQHRTNLSLAQFTREIVEDGVARRRNVVEQLLHQCIVMIGEEFQHGEPRFLLAIEIAAVERDDLGSRLFAIDEGALKREIDEAGDEIAAPDRNLPQHQRHARRRLQRRKRFADTLRRLVDLVEKQEAGIRKSSSSRKITCNCGNLRSSASQTTTAASTTGRTARMSCANSIEPGQSRNV